LVWQSVSLAAGTPINAQRSDEFRIQVELLIIPSSTSRCSIRSGRALLIGLVVMVIIVVFLWMASSYLVPHGPLEGDMRHDFGTLDLVHGEARELKHTFHLTNRTARQVTIKAVKPDCGCVAATVSRNTIEPGETLDLPVTLSLQTISKKVAIVLDLGEAGTQALWLHASGRFQSRLSASAQRIALHPGQPVMIKLGVEVFNTYDAPPVPIIKTPEGVTAAFRTQATGADQGAQQQGGWTLHFRPNDPRKAPCRWDGQVEVKADRAIEGTSQLLIEVKPYPPLRIEIVPASEGEPATQPAAPTRAMPM
jgi:hypothetical protein